MLSDGSKETALDRVKKCWTDWGLLRKKSRLAG
jgi:hypothetical protein